MRIWANELTGTKVYDDPKFPNGRRCPCLTRVKVVNGRGFIGVYGLDDIVAASEEDDEVELELTDINGEPLTAYARGVVTIHFVGRFLTQRREKV